ncbi:hypothetical protein V8C44DRAFT_353140 [Trichoderma aethiopicum]
MYSLSWIPIASETSSTLEPRKLHPPPRSIPGSRPAHLRRRRHGGLSTRAITSILPALHNRLPWKQMVPPTAANRASVTMIIIVSGRISSALRAAASPSPSTTLMLWPRFIFSASPSPPRQAQCHRSAVSPRVSVLHCCVWLAVCMSANTVAGNS